MVVTKESSTQGQRTSGFSHRVATWLAWSLCAVCVALIGLALLLDFLTGEVFPAGVSPARPGTGFAVLTGVLSLAFPTVGALIASRLPANPIGWIFCGMGLLYTAVRFTGAYADYALNENFAFPGGEYVAWFSSCLWFTSLTLGVFLVLLFPDGQLPSRWWRLVAWAAILGVALAIIGFGFMPDYLIVTHPYVENPFGIIGVIGGGLTTYELFGASRFSGMTLLLVSSIAALFSLFVRLHHTRGNERQQIKWFLFAAVPLTVFLGLFELSLIITNLTYDFLTYDFLNRMADIVSCRCTSQLAGPALKAVQYVAVLALLFVPIVTYIAILRHHLYDIDVVINRTLVYGALSASVVGIYVLTIVALGALFQAQGNLGVSLLATGLVAVLFQPLRGRLQRGVNRLMYGERDDPYAVVSRLGKRLEATLAPEAVLPTLVETIAQALKLPYAAILLKEDEEFRTAARYGDPADETVTLPLTYGAELVGRLNLAPRAPGEEFSSSDRRLLEDLARQAGVAAHAAR